MKTFIATLLGSVLMMGMAQAQPCCMTENKSCKTIDSVLISSKVDCEHQICTYKVRKASDNSYEMLFRMNLAEFTASFNKNAQELEALDHLVHQITHNDAVRIYSATVTGYTSPDGPEDFNQALAHKRASKFKNYLIQKYQLPTSCHMTTHSVNHKWLDCEMSVLESDMPHKEHVLEIIRSNHTEAQKEEALMDMSDAWKYLKREILPPMRRVDLKLTYEIDEVVEHKQMVCPAKQPETCTSTCEKQKMIDAEARETKLVTDMIENEAYYTEKLSKKEARLEKKAIRKEERMARKFMKEENKLLEQKAKADEKANKKPCKR